MKTQMLVLDQDSEVKTRKINSTRIKKIKSGVHMNEESEQIKDKVLDDIQTKLDTLTHKEIL